jgi:hypothetical protein
MASRSNGSAGTGGDSKGGSVHIFEVTKFLRFARQVCTMEGIIIIGGGGVCGKKCGILESVESET